MSSEPVRLWTGQVTLEGSIDVPAAARGVVVFSHGSGSSRHSPRNLFVAEALRHEGFGTLLLDLLGPEEDQDYRGQDYEVIKLNEQAHATLTRCECESGHRVRRHALVRTIRCAGAGGSTCGGMVLAAFGHRPVCMSVSATKRTPPKRPILAPARRQIRTPNTSFSISGVPRSH